MHVRVVIGHSLFWGLASLALVLGTPLALTASPPTAQRASTNMARVMAPPFSDVDVARARAVDDAWVVPRRDGSRAVLTVDKDLQSHMQSIFARYDVPQAGLAAIDPQTGRVLAFVGYDGVVNRFEGAVLVAAYIGYFAALFLGPNTFTGEESEQA